MIKRIVLLLVCTLAVVIVATSIATAHNLGYNSVRNTSGGGDLVIRDSTRYDAALNHGIYWWQELDCRWQGCPGVHVFKETPDYLRTLIASDYYQENTTTGGYYQKMPNGPDKIKFNVWGMDQDAQWQRGAMATHEIGHALQFGHNSQPPNKSIMRPCPSCGGYNTPLPHDDTDYYNRWIN